MVYRDGTELLLDPSVSDNMFHGEHGTLSMGRNNYRAQPRSLLPPPDKQAQQRWKGDGHVARPHLENWLECIRTRGEPNAPIEVGHRSVTVCHLANLARELGRSLRWNPQTEQFIDDEAANRLLSRPRRDGFELSTT
jgi:hypothetical protein